MRKLLFFIAAVLLLACIAVWLKFSPAANVKAEQEIVFKSAQIKGIQNSGSATGIAYTRDTLWKTGDDGINWRDITPFSADNSILSGVVFHDAENGLVIKANREKSVFEANLTADGGNSWRKNELPIRPEDLDEADFETVKLDFADPLNGRLTLRLPSSSNFRRGAVYATHDGGNSWQFEESFSEKNSAESGNQEFRQIESLHLPKEENIIQISRAGSAEWLLTQSGKCEGFKSGCYQTTKIYRIFVDGLREITPSEINNLAQAEKEKARTEATDELPNRKLAPGGNTRISYQRGFDKCEAGTVAQMQTWWTNSPYGDTNIYIAGRNRACAAQPNLNAAWVNAVSNQGWGLIPTIVGYQSPCQNGCANCVKFSTDSAVAETQGREEAGISVVAANNLGLTQGSVLYYDLESYSDTSGTGACSTPTKAFLKGWTDRVKELGYISGTYGSPTNAAQDWVNIPAASRMDAVWFARWDNIRSVWQTAPAVVPTNVWANQQRIKQYIAPANFTWGGTTFNIDTNTADGPVAAVAPMRKIADFDGDGKADVGVFRPDNTTWYVINSANGAVLIQNFGISTDRIVPGDYDGDGRTDFAVFRDGTWFQMSINPNRPNYFDVNQKQFGLAGDLPVPADYNGDGRTDLAVFRGGVWYSAPSFDPRDPTFRALQFGIGTDKPVPADYDGDGKADIAVFRNGTWYLLQTTAGFTAVQWGSAGDIPIPGDFDGDNKVDLSVYRNGLWFILKSSGGVVTYQWGIADDQPIAADYDGDNKTDVAVYRPSTGIWYILKSTGGLAGYQFGGSTDRAVPNAYLF